MDKIKELIKKTIGFLISIFKKIIDMVKSLIEKIKSLFKKILGYDKVGKNLTKPVSSGVIIVESAKVQNYTASTWSDIEKRVVSSCETLAKRIAHLEQQQLQSMKELDSYVTSQSRRVNEDSIPELDNICNMILK